MSQRVAPKARPDGDMRDHPRMSRRHAGIEQQQ
jgi:hypothetical protein